MKNKDPLERPQPEHGLCCPLAYPSITVSRHIPCKTAILPLVCNSELHPAVTSGNGLKSEQEGLESILELYVEIGLENTVGMFMLWPSPSPELAGSPEASGVVDRAVHINLEARDALSVSLSTARKRRGVQGHRGRHHRK